MTSFKILILDEAIEDFKMVFKYYEKINPKLAKKFHSAVNTSFSDLKRNPFYQIRYDEFRMKSVKKFPYIVHYIIKEVDKTVSIYGIRNSSQNPDDFPVK